MGQLSLILSNSFMCVRLCSQNSSVRVISRGFQSVGLLFLEIFGILEGSFSYLEEFIYRT